MRIISKAMWALLAALVLLWVGGGTPLEATDDHEAKCYADVQEAQYKKFTAPTDDGPFDKEYPNTWWKNKPGQWWPYAGEIVEGPGPHPDGFYVYKATNLRTSQIETECPPEEAATTTTEAEQTTTTTTAPEESTTTTEPMVDITATTAPPVIDGPATPPSTERLGDVCFQHITGGPTLAVGNFVTYGEQVPEATGTTNIGVAYCGPIPAAATTAAVSPAAQSLPATGTSNWALALIATMSLALGGSALWAARR